MKKAQPKVSDVPAPSTAALELERKILLDLGNDLTRVREKSDLIALFSKRLKGLFYFIHAIVTLIDHKSETISALLYDIETSPIQSHPGYLKLFRSRFSLAQQRSWIFGAIPCIQK